MPRKKTITIEKGRTIECPHCNTEFSYCPVKSKSYRKIPKKKYTAADLEDLRVKYDSTSKELEDLVKKNYRSIDRYNRLIGRERAYNKKDVEIRRNLFLHGDKRFWLSVDVKPEVLD